MGLFFWQNFQIFVRKSVFCYRTPDFVNGTLLALAKAKILAPSDPFLNFSFPSYGNFREGDPPTQQKVLPHLTVGALTDSNSPSTRSWARSLWARWAPTSSWRPFRPAFCPSGILTSSFAPFGRSGRVTHELMHQTT